MGIRFPGESPEYRTARDRLLQQEIELRRAMEDVAAARRRLPPGGPVLQDYVFHERGADGAPTDVRLSELFEPGKDSLVIYSMMFPRDPEDDRPGHCPKEAHPGFPWVDKSGAKRPDRGDSLAAHGPGQAIGLPASLTRGTAEAPGSRAARRAVAPATRSALEAGGAAPQALHRKGIAAVGARPSTGKASSRTVIKGSSYTHEEPGRPQETGLPRPGPQPRDRRGALRHGRLRLHPGGAATPAARRADPVPLGAGRGGPRVPPVPQRPHPRHGHHRGLPAGPGSRGHRPVPRVDRTRLHPAGP